MAPALGARSGQAKFKPVISAQDISAQVIVAHSCSQKGFGYVPPVVTMVASDAGVLRSPVKYGCNFLYRREAF